MKSVIGEYSLTLIAIIVVFGGILVFLYLLNNDSHGLAVVYNTNMVYANDVLKSSNISDTAVYDSIDGVVNQVPVSYKPYFFSTASEADYIFDVPSLGSTNITTYTYPEAVNLFSANGKIKLRVWNGSAYEERSLSDDVDIIIVKYDPVFSGTTGQVVLESVDVVDKYGNVVRNPDGTIKRTQQVKYNKTIYTRDNIDSFYINWDTGSRFKVIYRFTTGTLKSEYTCMFANKMRDGASIYEEVYEEWSEVIGGG